MILKGKEASLLPGAINEDIKEKRGFELDLKNRYICFRVILAILRDKPHDGSGLTQ